MAKNKGPKQIVPVCVFCGKSPLSEEHMWPDWLNNVVEGVGPHKHKIASGEMIPGTKTLAHQVRYNAGRTNRKRIKKFCEACNNQWMSTVESESIVILTSLIKGLPISLSKGDQQKLATWICLRCIVAEYVDESKIVIHKDRKLQLMNFQIPFDDVRIWIGKKPQGFEDYSIKMSYGSTTGPNITGGAYKSSPTNTKTFLLTVGELVIYVLVHRGLPLPMILPHQFNKSMKQIWPFYKEFDWSDLSAITPADYAILADNLRAYSKLF